MILLGIGANIPSVLGPPRLTCGAALAALGRAGVRISACSSWWRSAPVPASDQPWFVNAVAGAETHLAPAELLSLLLRIERAFGRTRAVPNAARTLDLDILDYRGQVSDGDDGPSLPHPRMAGRAFVILPLLEIEPDWHHPVDGRSVEALAGALPPGQAVLRMPSAQGLYGTEWERESPLPELAEKRSG